MIFNLKNIKDRLRYTSWTNGSLIDVKHYSQQKNRTTGVNLKCADIFIGSSKVRNVQPLCKNYRLVKSIFLMSDHLKVFTIVDSFTLLLRLECLRFTTVI